MNRFTHATNMLLNEFIRDNIQSPLYIDGEARIRTYLDLKKNGQLLKLISNSNGDLDFSNKWVVILLEDFITGHEGDFGDNTYINQLTVVRDLLKQNKLYLLFEDHYGPDHL